MLMFAAGLILFIGLVHSYLGERYLLIRLFKRDNIPHLFGSDWFTKQTLRFAWHLTTIAWWGFAALLILLDQPQGIGADGVLWVLVLVFGISGGVALIASKAKHLSWIVFFVIAGCCAYPLIAV